MIRASEGHFSGPACSDKLSICNIVPQIATDTVEVWTLHGHAYVHTTAVVALVITSSVS